MSSISPSTQITHKQSLKISETPRNGAAKSYMLPILLDLHSYLSTYCIIFGKQKNNVQGNIIFAKWGFSKISLAVKDLFLKFIHHSISPNSTDDFNQNWDGDSFGHSGPSKAVS